MDRTRRIALLAAPAMVLGSMALAFTQLGKRYGPRHGYLLGFLVYWLGWCFLFPLWILGRRGLVESFRRPGGKLSIADLALLAPPAIGLTSALPKQVRGVNAELVLESLAVAAVNATGEELLWRACYQATFPESRMARELYPAAGFALWHLAPQLVRPSSYPGGAASFVAFSGSLGLLYGWTARRAGSIRRNVVSHTLLDFSGLGARAFHNPATGQSAPPRVIRRRTVRPV